MITLTFEEAFLLARYTIFLETLNSVLRKEGKT